MSRERTEIWEMALKLARTGAYNGSSAVERELQELGYSAAQRRLSEEDLERLDQLCAEARKGRDDA